MDSASVLLSAVSTMPIMLSSDAGGPAREAILAANHAAAQKPTTETVLAQTWALSKAYVSRVAPLLRLHPPLA